MSHLHCPQIPSPIADLSSIPTPFLCHLLDDSQQKLCPYKETGRHQTKARVPPLPATKSRNRLPIFTIKQMFLPLIQVQLYQLRFVCSFSHLLRNLTHQCSHTLWYVLIHPHDHPLFPLSLPLSHHSFLFLSFRGILSTSSPSSFHT